jgi:hypothetical protein
MHVCRKECWITASHPSHGSLLTLHVNMPRGDTRLLEKMAIPSRDVGSPDINPASTDPLRTAIMSSSDEETTAGTVFEGIRWCTLSMALHDDSVREKLASCMHSQAP